MRKFGKVSIRILKVLGIVLGSILLIGLVCGFVFVESLGNYLQTEVIPQANMDLNDYDLEKTSYIYYQDENGDIQVLQKVLSAADRQWVSYENLPEALIRACVAIEDKRFFEHQGVDWITTTKAVLSMFLGGDHFGGSSLTQQLIKNLRQESSVTVQRKVMEIFRAQAFERKYDKKTILEWYLNTVYFGRGCYGVKSAASHYFGKDLQDMTTAELAALIGITNNPSVFDPYSKEVYTYKGEQRDGAGRNRYRQLIILHEMKLQGWISQAEYDEAISQEMIFTTGNSSTGSTQTVYSWYVDQVLEDVAMAMAQRDGVAWSSQVRSNYMNLIGRGGYHIYTAFDPKAQAAVDKVYTDLKQIPAVKNEQQLQSAIVVVDNRTGDIVALAGGVGEKNVPDAYNRATDAMLQVGSAIKPLTVFAPAFEQGILTPATVVDDLPFYYTDSGAFPNNDNKQYNYRRTALQGVVNSINTVAVNTLDRLSVSKSFQFATDKFRLTSLVETYKTAGGGTLTDIGYAPLALGALTVGATVRDVTCAYGAFANDGVYREGRTFLKVFNSNGDLVLDNDQQQEKILSHKAVNYMNYCLDSVVSAGTGTAADLYAELGMDVAGKTGSTSGYKDRYFSGFTGYYTASVWCGFDNPEQIILSGSKQNPAAVLWKKVMLQLHKGKKTVPLYDTAGMIQVDICLDSGKLATEHCCQDVRSDVNRVQKGIWVYPEDAPKEYCDAHVAVHYCADGHGAATPWCQLFAEAGQARLEEGSLVKMTRERLEQLQKAAGKGLAPSYLQENAFYMEDSDTPCHFCEKHTQKSWEEYIEAPPPQEEEAPEEGEDYDLDFRWMEGIRGFGYLRRRASGALG